VATLRITTLCQVVKLCSGTAVLLSGLASVGYT
jgi:hypothetical protein